MEIPPHCTVSNRRWRTDAPRLALLTTAVLLVHGFHPWAEDGGLYVADVELRLQPSLYPLDRPFVTASSHYSLFAPAVASLVRITHAPLAAVLLSLYLLSTALLLYASLGITGHCFPSQPRAQWAGVALLAAWWTMPVAGTSLLLMDPYLTARSFSTPLTLLALNQVLRWGSSLGPSFTSPAISREWPRLRQGPVPRCLLLLGATAAFHPLMAVHAVLFVLSLALVVRRAPSWAFVLLGTLWLAVVGLVQFLGQPEPFAVQLAVRSRDYWFLANWRWFEWLGLAGPLAILFALSRSPQNNLATLALCRSGLFVGLIGIAVSLLFVQEHFAAHTAARLQPLRSFLPIYALLPLFLGATLCRLSMSRFWRRFLPWTVVLVSAGAMFSVQRATFPLSPHVEWPGHPNTNPWVEAFTWARQHTAPDSLFALDDHYVNTPGEDAQNFRALAGRSAVPDFSKDGGEAANFAELAPAWLRGSMASARLSQLSDSERALRLKGVGVTWLVLHSAARTTLPCPYRNDVVMVCRY